MRKLFSFLDDDQDNLENAKKGVILWMCWHAKL